ncbi:MAG: DUF1318 domain-containing protein [Panacagrimonas sp.]
MMRHVVVLLIPALLLSACAIGRAYFPQDAAQRTADELINEVWGLPTPVTPAPQTPTPAEQDRITPGEAALNFVLPRAHAQDSGLKRDSRELSRLSADMRARFQQLRPYLQSGAIGLTAGGYLALRQVDAMPLDERSRVRNLVANENADRASLYRELAELNGYPKWETQFRGLFARRWIDHAQPGWYYQNEVGRWLQK